MEAYIAPSESQPDAFLSREQVLAALAAADLAVAGVAEEPGAGEGRIHWILTFAGTDIVLDFQATEDGLVFATLEHSMFDQSNHPDRICSVLEALGWSVDQENVG
jgi:hypothetical protein